ncbi:hypothetical protein JW949_02255 [Candidatus Woesearchaeota archaeon]|nr:hypothetical protein [Candidatus Woesearchaeota archaeon]
MNIESVVLDFDGTITDVDKESVPVVEGWKEDVGKELCFTNKEIQKRWNNAEIKIRDNPKKYGWIRGGKIIAPACADPLVMATVVTQVLFDEEKKYMDLNEREELIQKRFFIKNYEKAITVFKEGTDDFLSELKKMFNVYIVTNSDTSKVSEKIKEILTNHSSIPIYGNAKKYNLNLDWKEVPESIEREGFGRPLFLQREQYWNVLQKIMQENNIESEQMAVVGDIYELDLLLPEYKEMVTILTPRDTTADFELKAVNSYSKGYVTKNLVDVIKYLKLYK